MDKKGFTLIEILVVIALLAMLIIIVVPNIMKVVEKSKKGMFISQAKNIYNEAVQEYVIFSEEYDEKNRFYYAGEGKEENKLSLSGNKETYYDIEIYDDKVTKFIISDASYSISISSSNIKLENIIIDILKSNGEVGYIALEDYYPIETYNGNKPKLVNGMVPVKWDESFNESITTENDSEWYDYSQKKWANAKTADGSYWVWIPRYAYKITSCYHMNAADCEILTGKTAGEIDIKFLVGKTNTTKDGTIIKTSGYNADTNNTSMHYFLHPAFTFGNAEVEGIWIAKYEASVSNTSDLCYTNASETNCNKTTLIPVFKSNVTSWRYIKTGNVYEVAYNLRNKSNYGWQGSNVDTHMMKNTEWGAVAYLTQSIYGANQEIYINNSSTYTTGCAGNSVSEASYSGCQNAYNTSGGVKASTTHNITGIYDMSGGAYERTASYINNGDSVLTTTGNSIINAAAKYKDVYIKGEIDDSATNYTTNKNKYGDAIWETSSAGTSMSWYADSSTMAYSASPWFVRGGYWYNTTNSGAFFFSSNGGTAHVYRGFRPVAIIP